MKIKNLVLISLFAAMMCVFSIVRIPLPTAVPFTLQIFGMCMTGALLGGNLGASAMIIYTLLGSIGLPVFSGMTGGIHVLVGPTGGYILGFIISAWIIGVCMHGFAFKLSKPSLRFAANLTIMIMGLIISYITGTIQLKFVLGLSWQKAIAAGVAPFLLLDLVKIIWAAIAVHFLYPALVKSNLIQL